ncbi:MAG: hypothetical protein NTW87_27480 [Planctomycetota bacterium]|nr:hypothetical protein [Planctomycetota bacterium]
MYKEEQSLFEDEACDKEPLFFDSATADWKREQDDILRDAGRMLLAQVGLSYEGAAGPLAKATMAIGKPIPMKAWRTALAELEGKTLVIEKGGATHPERWRIRRLVSP